MLNFNGCDEDDVDLLEKSYQAIKQKGKLSIITDESEKNNLIRQVHNAIDIPDKSEFYFQNLFKIMTENSSFYLAQCLIDFGYPESRSRGTTWIHTYHFQMIGFANLSVDLGKTYVRPETRMDEQVNRFFNIDVDIEDCEVFNKNYHVSTNSANKVRDTFDENFVRTIGKYRDVQMLTKNDQIYIFFDSELHAQQSRIVEDIFSNCRWLTS